MHAGQGRRRTGQRHQFAQRQMQRWEGIDQRPGVGVAIVKEDLAQRPELHDLPARIHLLEVLVPIVLFDALLEGLNDLRFGSLQTE